MSKWFGRSWGAPVCDPREHVPTPVGRTCQRCIELILVDSQGVTMPLCSPDKPPRWLVWHLDCYLQTILPHDVTCPHCRGKERNEHPKDCASRRGEYCDCAHNPFRDPANTQAKAND